jgi:hypothetical protein
MVGHSQHPNLYTHLERTHEKGEETASEPRREHDVKIPGILGRVLKNPLKQQIYIYIFTRAEVIVLHPML